MSSDTKPRNEALFEGFASSPTIEMIGPWMLGLWLSLLVTVEGRVLSVPFVADPRQLVSSVERRSWKSDVVAVHGVVLAELGPGALM
jgi:hypothetical protein